MISGFERLERLTVEQRTDRIHVRLDRPAVRNAIDQATVGDLHRICEALEREPHILIISGANGTFASGADIAELLGRGRDDAMAGINSGAFLRIAQLPMPVIAAIDGYALGAGAELAYAADFRIASTTARIGNPETSLGILAAAGATWRLPQLVGEPMAKEMLLAGRILSATEALAIHLVTEVHEPAALMAAADALADRIAANDQQATRATKAVLRAPADAHPLIDQQAQAELFESEQKFERMTAFLEKRNRR